MGLKGEVLPAISLLAGLDDLPGLAQSPWQV